MEGEKVVVRELDSGGRISSGRVMDSGIIVPSLGGCALGGFGDSATCTIPEHGFQGQR